MSFLRLVKRPGVGFALMTLASLLLFQRSASGWTPFYTYFGNPVKWNGAQALKIDPNCMTFEQAIATTVAWSAWSEVTTNSMLGSLQTADLSCATHYANGFNEMVFAPESMVPGGAWGVTSCRKLFTLYLECDILLNNNALMWIGASGLNEATGFPIGPAVIIHELGHFQGLGHSEGLNAMKSGIEDLGPSLVGGGSTAPPYADDAKGVRALYASGPRTNVFASAQKWVSFFGGQIQTTDANTLLPKCRGGNVTVTYTAVNNGTTHASNVGFKIYLSTNPADVSGYDVYSTFATVGAGTYFTGASSITVPTGIPFGTYYIHWMIDSQNQLAEWNEIDNRVHSALRLDVNC